MAGEAERQWPRIERRREGTVVDLDRSSATRGELSGHGRIDPVIDEEVTATISVIRQVASVLAELQDAIRRQEEIIYDQRQTISELRHQKETVDSRLVEVERAAKTERERADRAESKVSSTDAHVRRLEDYSVSLRSHLTSVTAAVKETFASSDISASTRFLEDRSA